MKNEILEELWKIKDEIAGEHGFNIDSIAENLMKKEKKNRNKIMNFSKKVKKAA